MRRDGIKSAAVDAFQRREFVVGVELGSSVSVVQMSLTRSVIIRITIWWSKQEGQSALQQLKKLTLLPLVVRKRNF